MPAKPFHKKVLAWYRDHGRSDLPWQQNPTPYRVWVSEIMLHQTQVSTVIPYYEKFMTRFPSLKSLARAKLDTVLAHWAGLGYYSRARNLHKCAQLIHQDYHGAFPDSVEQLVELPGIGRSTAGAIVSLSMQVRAAILDGNVKRVLARCFAIEGWPGHSQVAATLWQLSEQLTPKKHAKEYNQGMMDLGAMICTRTKPKCDACPLINDCKAHQAQRIEAYPGKKVKRDLPQRQTLMLIKQESTTEKVYLIKRPPTGIWASLWSFPEFSDQNELQEYLQLNYPQAVNSCRPIATINHAFSHYKLEIQAVMIEVKRPVKTEESSNQWISVDGALKKGIASPVKKLLKSLSEKPNAFI